MILGGGRSCRVGRVDGDAVRVAGLAPRAARRSPGGTEAGSFAFGVSGSGGRIDRVNSRLTLTIKSSEAEASRQLVG